MLVTPDDFLKLKERILDNFAHLGNEYAMGVFDQLVADIQPRLVITEAGGAAEWYETVILARAAIAGGSRGVSPGKLDRLAQIATKYMKVVGPEPQRRFAFMLKADLRAVAEDDWSRVIAAGEREDAKTAAIAAGSVIEAVVLDVLERLSAEQVATLRDVINALPEEERKGRPARGAPHKWPFACLISAIGPHGLKVLSPRTNDIGHTLRDWRNLVHPNEARKEEPLTAADGRIAVGFAEKVIEDVEAWNAAGAKLSMP